MRLRVPREALPDCPRRMIGPCSRHLRNQNGRPVGENGASSATPWTAGEAVGPWPDAGCLVKAVGEIPPAGAVADGTPVPPPMTAPVVVAFGIPGALVRFPDEPLPRAFKLGLPVPAAPLPAGLPRSRRSAPPPHRPRGHPQRIPPVLRRQRRHCPCLLHPLRRQVHHHGRRHRRPTQIPRAVRLWQRESQTSRIVNDHGALRFRRSTNSVGLSCTAGRQQKVTALDSFQTSRKLARDR